MANAHAIATFVVMFVWTLGQFVSCAGSVPIRRAGREGIKQPVSVLASFGKFQFHNASGDLAPAEHLCPRGGYRRFAKCAEVQQTHCWLLSDALITSTRLHKANACILLHVAALLSSPYVICVGNYCVQQGCGLLCCLVPCGKGQGRHRNLAIVSLCHCHERVRVNSCVSSRQYQHLVLYFGFGDPIVVQLTWGSEFVTLSVLRRRDGSRFGACRPIGPCFGECRPIGLRFGECRPIGPCFGAVSYTHLTLPTISSV